MSRGNGSLRMQAVHGGRVSTRVGEKQESGSNPDWIISPQFINSCLLSIYIILYFGRQKDSLIYIGVLEGGTALRKEWAAVF